MVSLLRMSTTAFGMLLGAYTYLYLHEYTHWFAGTLFSGGPTVLYESVFHLPQPYAVRFDQLQEMSDLQIRIAGLLPHILWTGIFIGYTGIILPAPQFTISLSIWSQPIEWLHTLHLLEISVLTSTLLAGIAVSPADLVAGFRPSLYRKFTKGGLSHKQWSEVLTSGTLHGK